MKRFFILFSIILSPLTATEHAAVGIRPLSSEVQASLDAIQNEFSSFEDKDPRAGFLFDRHPPVYLPSSCHWLSSVSILGDQIETEDGTVWKIHPYDSYKPLSWLSDDPLVVTQNHRWFSKYDYKIINQNTGSGIEANLYLGPIQDGEYTLYISNIDYSRGEIFLTNGSYWEVSYFDSSVFKEWAVEDVIILGINTGWDSKCEAILINVTMNNHIRAKQI